MLRTLALASLFLLASCASTAPTSRELRVASDLDNRPFAWVDEQGTPRGRDVEMMQRIAQDLGRELVWKRMAFDELLPACERGDVDVVCATLGVTEERSRRVRFTRPYFATAIRVVVRNGGDEPRSLAELAGKRVAASPDTTSEDAVRAKLASSVAVLAASKDAGPIAQRLESRAIDAAVMDGPAAEALVVQSDGRLALLEQTLASELYALALPRDRAELCTQIDAELARLEPELRELDRRFRLH